MPVQEIFLLGELFERVQMEMVFPDGKTFVDCTPTISLDEITKHYESGKNEPGFDLHNFVEFYFTAPQNPTAHYETDASKSVSQHIMLLWHELTREPSIAEHSLVKLPHPYIVPGGRFREIFYWDSYFTMLGLKISGRIDMIENMVGNFSFLIDRFGYIPNGNRTYFLGRSQPPFFAAMVNLLAEAKGETVLLNYLPQLLKEHSFWMNDVAVAGNNPGQVLRVIRMENGSVLNRYCDNYDTPRPESYKEDIELSSLTENKELLYQNIRAACESGWDFSSRWFTDPTSFDTIHTTDIIPIDLNCLLHHLETTIAKAASLSKDHRLSARYLTLSLDRKTAINNYCWSEKDQCFFDYDFIAQGQIKSFTPAASFPLYFEIANAHQASGIAAMLNEKLLRAGGIVTSVNTTGQQWDAPNGWAPLQWIAASGLKRYGFDELANTIAARWTTLNEKVYTSTGKMMEKYNVEDLTKEAGGGEYNSQDGFGWTNAVYLAFKEWLD